MNHSPLMQGNPFGTCPEYGDFFYENGQEMERCSVCGKVGKVIILKPDCLMTSKQIAQDFTQFLKKNLLFFKQCENI